MLHVQTILLQAKCVEVNVECHVTPAWGGMSTTSTIDLKWQCINSKVSCACIGGSAHQWWVTGVVDGGLSLFHAGLGRWGHAVEG